MGVVRIDESDDDEFAFEVVDVVFLGGEGVGLGGVELVILVHNAKSLRVALIDDVEVLLLLFSSFPVFVSFLLDDGDVKEEFIKGFLHNPPTMPSSARVFNETQEASNK